jgi:CHAT domain-containing protein/Tfp pilus assembly protein PilF
VSAVGAAWGIAISLGTIALFQVGAPQNPETIPIGGPIAGVLEPAGEAIFLLLPVESGPLTISVESFDFDAVLRVSDEAGKLVLEDDDDGLETNALGFLEAAAGARFQVSVTTKEGRGGEFTLAVSAGRPSVERHPLADALSFRRTAAERALRRGDARDAVRHRAREAWLLEGAGRLPEAREAHEVVLGLVRRFGLEDLEAKAVLAIASVEVFLGNPERARRFAEEALVLLRARPERSTESIALFLLGRAERMTGDIARAREHLDASLAIARETDDRYRVAWCVYELGGLRLGLGELPDAARWEEEALTLFRELRDPVGEAWATAILAQVHEAQGRFAEAGAGLEAALEAFRKSGNRVSEAVLCNDLGGLRFREGRLDEAKRLFEESLDIARAVGKKDTEAMALGNLGLLAMNRGDFAVARESYGQSLDAHRAAGSRASIANALGNLGLLFLKTGEYVRAKEVFEEQLALARAIGSPAVELEALGALGQLHHDLTDYERALEIAQTRRTLAAATAGPLEEAGALALLSDLHLHLGRLEEAEEFARRALALARENRSSRLERRALNLLGLVQLDQGRFDEADRNFGECLEGERERGDGLGAAIALQNLAYVSQRRGHHEEAIHRASEALDRKRRLGARGDSLLISLLVLAQSSLEDGDVETARGAQTQAIEILEEAHEIPSEGPDSPDWRSRFWEWGALAQDLAALRLERLPDAGADRDRVVGEGFLESGRWKGRSLLEGIVEHYSGGRSADAIRIRRERRELLARRDHVLERVASSIREGATSAEVEASRGEADELLEEARKRESALREISPRDFSLHRPPVASPQVVRREALPDRAVLVDYAEGMNHLYAYVLTAESLEFVDLGDKASLEGSVRSFLEGIQDPATLHPLDRVRAEGSELFERLLAPVLRAAPQPVDRLVIVPSLALASLPFEALVVPASAGEAPEFVIDRYEVVYGPSCPVLVELASQGPRKEKGRVLVLADPLYPSEPETPQEESPSGPPSLLGGEKPRASPDPQSLPRLEKTREEALAIARTLLVEAPPEGAHALLRLADRRSGALSLADVDLRLGADASPLVLDGDLRSYSVLHIAAHGFVDRERPRRTAIALSFSEGEGFLRIEDVLQLDLDANLVVLSACETARGQPLRGEGVQSLTRAFLYAGARSVVASLWAVTDWSATETMAALYEAALRRGAPVPRALREAKLAVRRSGALRGVAGVSGGERGLPALESAHPFFWAPFILIGATR